MTHLTVFGLMVVISVVFTIWEALNHETPGEWIAIMVSGVTLGSFMSLFVHYYTNTPE